MMKCEFEEKLGSVVPADVYKEIEYVYTWHPAIDANNGKKQIAEIYRWGGLAVIRNMKPTAEKAEQLDAEIRHARHALEQLQEQWAELKRGEG